MAWPDLESLLAKVRIVLDDTTTTFFSDAQLTRLLNDAYRDIAIKSGCIEDIDTLATTASSRLVQFSGLRVNWVEYNPASGTAVIALRRIHPNRIGHVILDGVLPQYWFQWGQYIYIEPVPDAVYSLFAYVSDYPPRNEMFDTSDTPGNLPTEFLELLIDYTVSKALLRDKQFTKSNYLYTSYTKKLMEKSAIYMQKQTERLSDMDMPDKVMAR